MQQNQPGSEPGDQEGEGSDQQPTEQSEMAMSESNGKSKEGVLPENVPNAGGEWGQLRSRRTDDAAESQKSRVAPQYRREVDAYFRAIAKRAAEKKE